MATNHTENSTIAEHATLDYLWKYLDKPSTGGITLKQAKNMATWGGLSISNILERAILISNKKLKKSNKDGEDFSDKSDAKYMTARPRKHGKGYKVNMAVLSPASIKTKKGTLRIFITHIHKDDSIRYRMFVIPYKIWKTRMVKSGIGFSFSSKDGELTPTTVKRWGEFESASFKQFCI